MEAAALDPEVHQEHSKVVEFPYLMRVDMTGKFPAQPRSGVKYLLVLHNYDSSAMLADLMLRKKYETLRKAALQKWHKTVSPLLGNEAITDYSSILKD